ncbi:MAG: S8 family serine peptidase [Bacteroidota bacterium]|nr:S8 family serine peptidase [Bacteroidota bacterium]
MKIIVFFLFLPSILLAQDGAFRYFISFTDKVDTNFSVNSPEEYLSIKTIAKRKKFFIAIDSTDLPVSSIYIDALKSSGFLVENTSKWFNGVIVSTYDSLLITSLNYVFIDSVVSFGSWQNTKKVSEKWQINYDISDYGLAFNQLQMLGGDLMHSKGFKGNGITIAVIDAGFYKVNQLDLFRDLQNQILSTYDFVDGNSNVYDDHTHGMMVLSTMGAKGIMMGTAPDAQYLLLRSEDVFSENLIEEFMWVCAAEYADSAGADIINSSLGYTTFDDTIQNHTYADMDGVTTPISIGAGMACDKGMIVVNSAGNSGNSTWHYIGAPADNFNVLTVGAVDENEEFALFSSYGPNTEGAVKPNVMAQGKNIVVATSDNGLMNGNGTSFSSPVTAGMVACLWGANSDKSSFSIKDAIYKSADRYLNPDNQFGYGIPNYYSAYQYLNYDFTIPINEGISQDVNYTIYSIDGKLIDYGILYYNNKQDAVKIIKPKTAGAYIIHLISDSFELNKKFIVFE